MIRQVIAAASSETAMKITIKNFQKRENAIFTSDRSSIELDTQVKYIYFTRIYPPNEII